MRQGFTLRCDTALLQVLATKIYCSKSHGGYRRESMGEITSDLENAIHERIREAGLRLTMPRRAICAVLASNDEGFLTTQEILSRIEAQGVPIDPSTAYRTLDDLAKIGLIHHVHLGNQPGRWHLTMEHDHQHLVCEVCGKTTLVPTEEVQPMFDHLLTAYGFHTRHHHFAIMGNCDSCSAGPDHIHA